MILNKILTVVANRFIILIATTFLAFSNAFSQSQNGKLSGTVYGDKSDPIKEAVVSIGRLSLTTSTNGKGAFSFTGIAANTYEITIYAVGHETKKQTVSIHPDEENNIEINLQRNTTMLEAVTITAEKRATILQKTPASVSVLNAQKMEDYRLWSMRDLSAVVPNLLVSSGTSSPYFNDNKGSFSDYMGDKLKGNS